MILARIKNFALRKEVLAHGAPGQFAAKKICGDLFPFLEGHDLDSWPSWPGSRLAVLAQKSWPMALRLGARGLTDPGLLRIGNRSGLRFQQRRDLRGPSSLGDSQRVPFRAARAIWRAP
jgi:hypothetical protein